MQVFAGSLDMVWNGTELSTRIFDGGTETCITRDQMTGGLISLLGTMTVFDDYTGSMNQTRMGELTVAVKGQFVNCDEANLAYVTVDDPNCEFLRPCVLDEIRNSIVTNVAACFVTCHCSMVPCNIRIIPWKGGINSGVAKVCEVATFKYEDPTYIPSGFNS